MWTTITVLSLAISLPLQDSRPYWKDRAPTVGDTAPPLTVERIFDRPKGFEVSNPLPGQSLRDELSY